MRELFVYYRARCSDAPALQAAVFAFQEQLTVCYPSLRTRLLRRPEETDGEQTWMESYATDPQREPAGISEELQAEIDRRAGAVAHWVSGRRHTEVFLTCVEERG